MAVPRRSKKEQKENDFLSSAVASKADRTGTMKTEKRGRKPGVPKTPLNVKVEVNLHSTIKKYSGGNMAFFVDTVFREYFKNQDIEIETGEE